MPTELLRNNFADKTVFTTRHKKIIFLIVACMVLCILGYAFTLANYNLYGLLKGLKSDNSIHFITESVMGILFALMAATIYGAIENAHFERRLREIYNGSPEDLIDETLKLLKEDDGTVIYDYFVEYYLNATDNPQVLELKTVYRYEKKFNKRALSFKIVRLKTAKERDAFYASNSINKFYKQNELYYWFDEVALRKSASSKLLDSLSGLEYVRIDGVKVEPEAAPTEQQKWYARISDNRDLSSPISIEYAFRHAVSNDDVIYCVVESPTKHVDVRLVGDPNLAGRIKVEAFEMMSATVGTANVGAASTGVFHVTHPGWVLPKSGALFHWFPDV